MDQNLMEQLPNNATIELSDNHLRGSVYNNAYNATELPVTNDDASYAEIPNSVKILIFTFSCCIMLIVHKLKNI